MERIVADASVIVKFFKNEDYSEKSRKLREKLIIGEIVIFAPHLLRYEVLNAMIYSKTKYKAFEINNVYRALMNYDLKTIDNGALFAEAIRISIANRLSIYDSTYVALASVTKSTLYTADQKLIDAVRLPFVKHIKDY